MYAVSFIAFLHDLLHPLHGDGYQFYSGIAGSFLMPTGMWTAVLFLAHHHRKHHRELIEALAARMPEGREG